MFDAVAEAALARYNIQDAEVWPLMLSENRTYLVIDPETGVPRAVLRLCRAGYHTAEEIEGEIGWLRALQEDPELSGHIVRPLPARDGTYVQYIEGPDGSDVACMAFGYVDGAAPDEHDPHELTALFGQIGSLAAHLHTQTEQWSGTRQIRRPVWDWESTLGPYALWGDWRSFEGFSADGRHVLECCSAIIQHRLDAYGRTPQNFGLIHADMRCANLIVDNAGELHLIDFDDCGFGWHLFDLAASLSFIETRPDACDLIDAWLGAYRSERPLGERDIAEIPTFIMMRRLQLTAWLASRRGSDPVAELAKDWAAGTLDVAQRFLQMQEDTD